jgi:hypothetical protein
VKGRRVYIEENNCIAAKNKVAIDETVLRKTRVCAYCRVSTDSVKQAESLETQSNYYVDYIKGNREWEFSGIFADQGISGTSTANRTET